ncbi:MAG TPA: T9SS type A sorting domain-containing protein [Ferruginibacter sp.]|nr:T9SS type A sorting domain-containing protein [Ferruginibacter sp.]
MNRKYIYAFLFCLAMPVFLLSQTVNMDAGIQLVAKSTIALVVDNGELKNDGIFIPDSSTVYFDGPANISISGTQPTDFFNLTFRGSGLKRNENTDTIRVYNTLASEGTTTVDADGNINNRTFVLRSINTSTANVAVIPAAANIVGDVIVERYIHTPRKWQLLAVPTNTPQTFFESWQENGAAPIGFGTAITMPAPIGPGLDFASPGGPSLKYLNAAGNNFIPVNNTNVPIATVKDGAYYIFVRGDRTILSGTQSGNTTLRTKGPLNVHYFSPVGVSLPTGIWKTMGNPYASAIDFQQIVTHSSLDNEFQLWDPKRPGNYTLGAYVSFSSSTATPWSPVPAIGGSYSNPNTRIESGQGFLVMNSVSPGAISFEENDKASGSRNVNRFNGYAGTNGFIEGRSQFNMLAFAVGGSVELFLDGNATVFGSEFSSEYDSRDVDKMSNGSDNFAIDDKQAHTLIVDTRPGVTNNDTIHYDMALLKYQNFRLKFYTENFISNVQAWLIDKYLQTETPLNTSGDTSSYDFSISANPASKAADRFKVVFKQSVVVPVTFITVSASRNANKTITVNWRIENEENIVNYEVQRSSSATGFSKLGDVSATNSSTYQHVDELPLPLFNYYRIKAIGLNGEVLYSNVVKVGPEKINSAIQVYPNPIADKEMGIYFNNVQPGNYLLQLIQSDGKIIQKEVFALSTASHTYRMPVNKSLASGNYILQILCNNKQVAKIPVSIL